MIFAAVLSLFTVSSSVTNDITYSKAGGADLKLDIYQPMNAGPGPFPGVVLIHGGAWVSGKKADMNALADGLAKQGFVVANVEYRLAPKFKWPAMLDDVQTATRFLRANAAKYAVDPKRIGSCGASAGGHLAMFLGVSDTRDPKPAEFAGVSSKVKAVFNFFGPCDMSKPFPPVLDGVYQMVLGKKKADAAEEIRSASPYYLIDKMSAPMFIYQGMADPLVNPEQARLAVARYKEVGVECDARYLDGVGHEIKMTDANAVKAVEAGVAFLKKHLAK